MRIAVLYDGGIVEDPDVDELGTVVLWVRELRKLGHDAWPEPAFLKEAWLRDLLDQHPDLVVNLCDTGASHADGELAVAALLGAAGVAFTGAHAGALALCRDKLLTSVWLRYHGVPTPDTDGHRRPVIVKPRTMDASEGIDRDSVVWTDEALEVRVRQLQAQGLDPIYTEQYIDGREFQVWVHCGAVMRPIEVTFHDMPEGVPHICTYDSKWDQQSDEYRGRVDHLILGPTDPEYVQLQRVARLAYNACVGTGSARIDVRWSGGPYVVDVNPNAMIFDIPGDTDVVRETCALDGWSIGKLLEKLIEDALTNRVPSPTEGPIKIKDVPKVLRPE